MSVKTFSFYHKDTGMFSGRQFTGPENWIGANTPPDHHALEGAHDHLSRKVDLDTLQVVDHQPDAPSSDHEWNSASKRWDLKPEVAAAVLDDHQARGALSLIDLKTLRTLRELYLDPKNLNAHHRLIQLEADAGEQRKRLR